MGSSSFVQDDFRGGMWSDFAQGRMKDEDYGRALAECFNSLPVEEGAWVRRGGTQVAGHTYNGLAGKLLRFAFTAQSPHNAELTDSRLRMWDGVRLVSDDSVGIGQISLTSPAVVTTLAAKTWTTGMQVYITASDDFTSFTSPYIANRQFRIVRLTSTTFELHDPVSGLPIDGAKIGWPLTGMTATMWKILEISTPFDAAAVPNVRGLASDEQLYLLSRTKTPIAITAVEGTPFATFAKTTPEFRDGPYMDPPRNGTTLTPSGSTGSINLTASSTAGINGGLGWLTTDVGRLVRFNARPAAYNPATAYTTGQKVMFNDVAYVAASGSTGNRPDVSPTVWIANPAATAWTWLRITARTSATVAVATVMGADLAYTTASALWALGLYSDTTGYPTCGCYHEGRIWLSGAQKNRVDACRVNQFDESSIEFAPSSAGGVVADSDAIAYTFRSTDKNDILWMRPTANGISCGTDGAEWLIQATAEGQVLTPSNVQAHPVTGYGCANIEPVRAGISVAFVQKNLRKIHEYIADAFSGKFSGPNLAAKSKSLTQPGVAELAYQEEIAPVIWMRLADGSLVGTTYRRTSPYTNQPAEFNGWHRHTLGSDHIIESITTGQMASAAGTIDTLAMVTTDTTLVRYVEFMRKAHDENDVFETHWHVDFGIIPSTGRTVAGGNSVRFYGLHELAGQSVACVVGGLDCGDHTVNADGYVDVPYGQANGEFTYTYLAELTNAGKDFGDMAVSIDLGKLRVPVCIGYNFISRGKGLRPASAADTGAEAGPGFAKVKRASSFGVMLKNVTQIYFGTDFDRMRPASFRNKGKSKVLPLNQPFSGIYWDPLEGKYDFDSQFAWEVRRPWPCALTAFGLFEHTEDRN